MENELVKSDMDQIRKQQENFELFDIYDKGVFDFKSHLRWRL